MKKYVIYLFLFMFLPLAAMAQSSMTDQQVMQFIVKEHNSGKSQSEIVTKLMQRGVDISQIRRVRNKYERQMKQGGLGNVSDNTTGKDESRLRTNNGNPRELTKRDDYGKEATQKASQYSSMRLKAERDRKYKNTYDETDEEFMDYQREMFELVPDTAQMLEQLLAERDALKKKVFGRDIFNNQELSFEPNMNIATPQSYVLGPGDAVFVDIYGASQKSEQCTVSPEGEITIEGFGPVHVGGLTVDQANRRLRSTLGARYSSSKVKLSVGQTRTIIVNVMGEVKTPGTYTLSAFATVFHALYMAGGTNDLGTLRNIKVYRNLFVLLALRKFTHDIKFPIGKLIAVAIPNTNHRRILRVELFAIHDPLSDFHQSRTAIFLIPKAIAATRFCLLYKRMLRHRGHNDDLNLGIVLFNLCRSLQTGFFLSRADIHQNQIDMSAEACNFCIRCIFD